MIRTATILLALATFTLACSDTDPAPPAGDVRLTPEFVTELVPVDDSSGYYIAQNVIQGFTAFEGGWFTAQTSANTTLLINYLGADGRSQFHVRLPMDSHGQDLSLEVINENELYLYTTIGPFNDTRNTGIVRLHVALPPLVNGQRDMAQTVITVDNEYNLNYSNCTPTLDEAKLHFAIRSGNTILVHDKEVLLSHLYNPLYFFDLNGGQLTDEADKSMWFQGIAMKNDQVYCLTGNDLTYTSKKLYVYDKTGIAIGKYVFDLDSFNEPYDIKLEPESLAFIGEELYFTMMTKKEGIDGNIKYLYKVTI